MTKKYWECDHYKATGVTDESGKYWDGPGLCDLNDKFCVMEGDMPCEIFDEEEAEAAMDAEANEERMIELMSNEDMQAQYQEAEGERKREEDAEAMAERGSYDEQ